MGHCLGKDGSNCKTLSLILSFLSCSVGKEFACNAGDPGSIPGLGRSAGEGIGYPLQDSRASLVAYLLKNPPATQETPVQLLGEEICWRTDRLSTPVFLGFPCGSAGKESTCNAGDLGSIPGLGRSPGEGKGYHSSILAWRIPLTILWGPKELDTTERLSLSNTYNGILVTLKKKEILTCATA